MRAIKARFNNFTLLSIKVKVRALSHMDLLEEVNYVPIRGEGKVGKRHTSLSGPSDWSLSRFL